MDAQRWQAEVQMEAADVPPGMQLTLWAPGLALQPSVKGDQHSPAGIPAEKPDRVPTNAGHE